MPSHLNRRKFITQLGFAGAATLGFPAIVRGQNLNSKLQVGFVAVGGKGRSHVDACHRHGLQCVAFADIDKTTWNNVSKKKGWARHLRS